MKTIYFVRHGECQANVDKRTAGRNDSPLTELGLRQADETGGKLQGLSECMMRTIYGNRPYQTWLETPDLLNGHIREYEVST